MLFKTVIRTRPGLLRKLKNKAVLNLKGGGHGQKKFFLIYHCINWIVR